MKILKKILLWLVIVIVAVSVLAQFLPSQWKASRSIVINASPEAVYPYLESPRNWAQWNSFTLEDTTTVHEYSGPEAGVGAEDSWDSKKFGPGRAKVIQEDAPTGVEYELYLNGAKEPAKGLMLATPVEGGTRVTYSVEGKYGFNPVHRIFGLFVGKFLGPFFERSLENLKALVESRPAPASTGAAGGSASGSDAETALDSVTYSNDPAAGTAAGGGAGGGIQTGRSMP